MNQTYKLNMVPNLVPTVVRCSQYDTSLRQITFTMLNGSEAYEIPADSTVTVRGNKPDGTVFEYEASYTGNTVSFYLREQMTVLSGKIICEVRITNLGDIIGSANFTLFVEPAPINEDTPVSETDLPMIEEAIQKANELIEDMGEGVADYLQNHTAEIDAAIDSYIQDNPTAVSDSVGNWLDDNTSVVANATEGWIDDNQETVQQTIDDWLEQNVFDDELSDTSTNAVQNKVVTEALNHKAEIDGLYEDMTVGNAEQLITGRYVSDSEPYLFRTSGGSADIGDRLNLHKIVGGSIVWNQALSNTYLPSDSVLYSADTYTANNVTFTKNANGGYTISTTSEGASVDTNIKIGNTSMVPSFLNGHINAVIMDGIVDGVVLNWSGVNYSYSRIYQRGPTTGFNILLKVLAGTVITTPINVYPQIFDLTQMFGSTIAAYIQSLGNIAGVAWFRKLFPKSYYAYNSGEIMSVSGLQSHDMTGFNLLNPTTWTAQLVGGMQHEIVGTYTSVSYVDIDGNAETLTISDRMFTPTNNGTLTVVGGDDTTCVHLVWSGTHNGEYYEYEKHSYPLDSTLTLRGIPKLDANNKLYYDGDTYEPDGTVTRRYGVVDLGTLTWSYQSGNARFQSSSLANVIAASTRNFLATKYQYGSTTSTDQTIQIGSNGYVYIRDTSYTDAATFKTAMSGVYLVYELATPTTETAESYNEIQIVNDWGTEEFVTDSIVPVGHETDYWDNAVDKLNHLPSLADADGDYIIRQSGTQMTLIPYADVHELPDAPTTDGTYVLKVTVNGSNVTYSWEAE